MTRVQLIDEENRIARETLVWATAMKPEITSQEVDAIKWAAKHGAAQMVRFLHEKDLLKEGVDR